MPALHIVRQGNQNNQMRSQLRMRGYSEDIHQAAHAADQVRQESVAADDDLSLLESQNNEFVSFTARNVSQQYVAMIVLFAVYIIDTLLFGGVATLLAKSAFPDNAVMHYVIKIASPLAFLGLEIYLAWLIYEKRQSIAQQSGKTKRVNLWIFVGLVFALVMPVLVISSLTDTFRLFSAGESLAKLLTARLIGLTLTAFIVHCVVIFSGGFAVEAKAYFMYRARRRSLLNVIQDRNRSFDLHCQSLVNAYNRYALDMETHNRQFPEMEISPLNLDSLTRDLIRECMTGNAQPSDENGSGEGRIQGNQNDVRNNGLALANNEARPDSGQSVTANNEASSNGGRSSVNRFESPSPRTEDQDDLLRSENEHLRQILTQRMRDADDVVK